MHQGSPFCDPTGEAPIELPFVTEKISERRSHGTCIVDGYYYEVNYYPHNYASTGENWYVLGVEDEHGTEIHYSEHRTIEDAKAYAALI